MPEQYSVLVWGIGEDYDDLGNLEKYNIYSIKMLVRRDKDGKLYLYDFIKPKKEDVQPA